MHVNTEQSSTGGWLQVDDRAMHSSTQDESAALGVHTRLHNFAATSQFCSTISSLGTTSDGDFDNSIKLSLSTNKFFVPLLSHIH
jgi:hypothetical protein